MKLRLLFFILVQLFCFAAMADFVATDNANNDDVYVPQNKPVNQNNRYSLRPKPKQESHGFFSLLEADAGVIDSTVVGPLAGNGYSNGHLAVTGGATMDLFRGSFVAETGLQYRQMGYTLSEYGMNIGYIGNYLAVPVFLKYYLAGHPENTLFAKIGCYNSFLTSNQSTTSNGFTTFTTTGVPLSQFDWAPAAGLGGTIRLSNKTLLVIQGLYSISVTSVYNYNPGIYYASFIGTAGIAIKL